MGETRLIMGMPITIDIDASGGYAQKILNEAFDFFTYTDQVFSTYKDESEISRINSGQLTINKASADVRQVLKMCADMKTKTRGYFDIYREEQMDPSGLVKGWSIGRVGQILDRHDVKNYYIDAGGDILVRGHNSRGQSWGVGIRLPTNPKLIAKKLQLSDMAVATSANYERGEHIYNPLSGQKANQLQSVTIVGPDICLADVMATTIFAMGHEYSQHIANVLPKGYEAYIIEGNNSAILTSGFNKYLAASS